MPHAPSTNPAPTRLAEILEPSWLEAHVYADLPGVRVTGTTVVWKQENTATKVRLTVEAENAPDDMVRALCVKGMLDESGAPWLKNGNSRTEANFYADLAPALRAAGLRLPDCLYTAVDPANGHGLIVMRDMESVGAQFLTALTPYTADQARDSLGELARLHVATGPGSAFHAYPLQGTTLGSMADQSLIPLDLLQELLDGPRGDPLPAALRDAARLHAALGRLRDRCAGLPSCIVHGDAHAGNLYRHEGGAGIIDWQIPQHGHWALDVAYHVGAALTVEDRRLHERALLNHYLDCREALGAPVADRPNALVDYGAAMLYGYYLWSITRRVQQDITHAFVERLGLAVNDHDSMARMLAPVA